MQWDGWFMPWGGRAAMVSALSAMLLVNTAQARELDDDTVLASPYRIESEATRGRIRYELRRIDDAPLLLPQSAEQRVVVVEGVLRVTVCAYCRETPLVQGVAPQQQDPNAAPWLSLNDVWVRRLAREPGVSRRDAHRSMRDLTQRVRAHFYNDGPIDEFLDAGRALRTRRGDCNEYARLLAALGRVRGIPTRVAIGVVYRPTHRGKVAVFVAHSWTQAWIDGAWHSFDAALGRFGAGHLMLDVSDGDPDAELGLLQHVGQLRILKAAQLRRQ